MSNPPENLATDSGDSASESETKYRSIKAFRTITTMLQLVPSERKTTVTVGDCKPHGVDVQTELKLLNALAVLLVRHHEVAAVAVTKYDVDDGVINVIACHSNHSPGPSAISQTQNTSSVGFRVLKNFLAIFNLRRDDIDVTKTSDIPVIIDPKNAHDILNIQIGEPKEDWTKRLRKHCFKNW